MPPTIQTTVKFRDFAHAFNASPYNLTSFLILRHSLHQCPQIFTSLEEHRPELRDTSGNFKPTPNAKFETMISEPRPTQRNNGQNCSQWLTFFTFSLLLCKND